MNESLLRLYEIESNLVQVKITHILTIRSLAVTVLAAVIGGALIYPGKNLGFLSLVLIPFYVLEATYDGYLMPFVERETILKQEISKALVEEGENEKLASAYAKDPNHRKTPPSWGPFKRALLEPMRLSLYSIMLVVPLLVLH